MAPNSEPLLVSNDLLQQAERACRRRLTSDPGNPNVLVSLAQITRKQGNLTEAAALYERLAVLSPDDGEAAYMAAVLAGAEIPVLPPGFRPAPFVLSSNFLDKAHHETLLPFVLSIEDKLVPAKVASSEYANGEVNTETRESLDLPGEWEIKDRFRRAVRAVIPRVVSQLQIALPEIGLLEVKVRVYLDGHFFRIHMDCPQDVATISDRRLSFVYFFHKRPRGYAGGDLLLFDTDTVANRFTTARFTRVVPEDNTIVFFPSAYYHSVIPVTCGSRQYEDSRFVINGHVSVRRPGVDVAPDESSGPTAPKTPGPDASETRA